MANQDSIQDNNDYHALIGHSGTAGTAETRRIVVTDEGAITISGGAGGGTVVQVASGTLASVGTVGVISNITSGSVVVTAGTVSDTTLQSLNETLQELVQRLMPLAGAMNNTAQLRTVVTGAVTATGGGYITSAQAVAALLTQTNSLLSSYRLESYNLLPTMANINNAVAA